MAVDFNTDDRPAQTAQKTSTLQPAERARAVSKPQKNPPFMKGLRNLVFFSLTRRIVVLNIAALAALVAGILYLNQFRAGLIDARVESLMTQGEIIAGAIAASATLETDTINVDPERLLRGGAASFDTAFDDDDDFALEFPINPERVGPVLRRLISPTQTRARIYDRDGFLLLDSRFFYLRGQVARIDAQKEAETEAQLERALSLIETWFFPNDLPTYTELGSSNGKGYPEVANALNGASASIVRAEEEGDLIVSVAVPIRRQGSPVGALLLSTEGGDISEIVRAERLGIMRTFLVAAAVTALLSVLLAGTIAGPIRRLSAAADRVRRSVKARQEIPEFSGRQDEIGHLARAFADMTNALYDRIAAIEAFAADVAHELKNPLTSLRSAVETLPLARTDSQRERLLEVIQHDVRRLDRLISDISDASRLDAELARDDAEAVDLKTLVESVVEMSSGVSNPGNVSIECVIDPAPTRTYFVLGHPTRLGQVLNNLIDNARSFSPDGGTILVQVALEDHTIKLTVDDEGPGIKEDVLERIFERFYTDRPEGEGFGNNSGLGLSISRQIIVAHRGTLTAENRMKSDGSIAGARFVVSLPAENAR